MAFDTLNAGENLLAIHGMMIHDDDHQHKNYYVYRDTLLQGTPIPSSQVSQPSITIEPEIDYNPSTGNQGEEYFILKNQSTKAVDISGWTISGAVKMTFKVSGRWMTFGKSCPALN